MTDRKPPGNAILIGIAVAYTLFVGAAIAEIIRSGMHMRGIS